MKRSILFFIVFGLIGVMTAAGQTESAAEKRARELVQVLNAGKRAEFQKFVEANFGEQMRGMPMERHLNFFSSVYDNSRGYEVSGVQDTKPNRSYDAGKKQTDRRMGRFARHGRSGSTAPYYGNRFQTAETAGDEQCRRNFRKKKSPARWNRL